MKRNNLILLWLLLLLLPVDSLAQKHILALNPTKSLTQYDHEVWQTENGLPQNSVTAILQTTDGYLWIGTYDGVCRFDGRDFTTINAFNHSVLKNADINTIFESHNHALWIGTRGDGLAYFKNNHLKIYTVKNGLPSNDISCIGQTNDGTIWVGTYDGGIASFKNNHFTVYPKTYSLHSSYIVCLYINPKGTIWFGTNGSGIIKYEKGKFSRITYKNGLSNDHIRDITEDSKGRLWVATSGGGITVFGKKNHFYINEKNGLTSNVISTIKKDASGSMWIGTEGNGLDRWYMGKISSYTTDEGLSNDVIGSLYIDKLGDLWIGTLGGGLNRFRDGKFTTYTSREGLSNNFVWTVFADKKGRVWIGTNGGGADILYHHKISVLNKKNGLISNFVRSIYSDSRGRIWIGTYRGISIWNQGHFKTLTWKDGLSGDYVLALYEDHQHHMWIGTNHGLDEYLDGKFKIFTTKNGLPNNYIRAIYEDRRGRMWIGTSGGGLSILSNGKFKNLNRKDGLSSDKVVAFFQDRKGTMWIGTMGGGLSRFQDGHFTNYTVANGLYDNGIYSIFSDKKGYLWMSCNRGIFKVSEKSLNELAQKKIRTIHCISYGRADGMKSTECNGGNQPAGCQMPNGELWYPTASGVTMINPNNLKINKTPPKVFIVRASADNKTNLLNPSARLGAGVQNFFFSYTAVSLNTIENVRFKYRLIGFDKKWVSAGSRRNAYYTNLPAGSYTFQVIACNSDGIWNTTGASVSFTIPTPFYLTDWAFLTYVLLLLVVILAIVHWQTNRIRQIEANKFEKEQLRLKAEQEHLRRLTVESEAREREHKLRLKEREKEIALQRKQREQEKIFATAFARGVEDERGRIAIELHDQILGSLSIVMRKVQSEIRSVINKNPVNGKLIEEKFSKVLPELDQISQDIREIMDNMKPGTLEFFGLTDALEGLLQKQINASGQSIKLILNISENITNPNNFKSITIYRIFQEAVTNAINHGQPTVLELHAEQLKNQLILKLIDNGCGFDFEEVLSKLNSKTDRRRHGLLNMIHRANTINASIFWSKTDTGGTIIRLAVPL